MRSVVFSVLALFTLGAAVAQADTFNFSFGESGDPIVGSGTLTGHLTKSGDYLITAIEGTTAYPGSDALDIVSLLKKNGFEGNDNLLIPTASGFDFDASGLSYILSDSTEVNLSNEVTGTGVSYQSTNALGNEYVPYSITATPEPGSLMLLGSGLLGTVGLLRRRL